MGKQNEKLIKKMDKLRVRNEEIEQFNKEHKEMNDIHTAIESIKKLEKDDNFDTIFEFTGQDLDYSLEIYMERYGDEFNISSEDEAKDFIKLLIENWN